MSFLPAEFFPYASPRTVDVPFEITAVQKLRQYKLLECRNCAGVKAELFTECPDELFRNDHVPDAHRRGDRFRKRVQIYHIVLVRKPEQRLCRLRGYGKFGAVIGFYNEASRFVRPADVFVTLGRRSRYPARKALIRRGVQNIRLRRRKGAAVDPVLR